MIIFQPQVEALAFECGHAVQTAPVAVRGVEVGGRTFKSSAKLYELLVFQKADDVAVILFHLSEVAARPVAYREFVIIGDQTTQTLVSPKEYSLDLAA